VFGNKVFSRKGSFLARDVDPPIGEPIAATVREPSPEPVLDVKDTSCYEGGNIRVRVLKPDAAFIRDISKRLARLDVGVRKLNEKNHTES
jgi:hypothetical protein